MNESQPINALSTLREWYRDDPINTSESDVLHREVFVRNIADEIMGWHYDRSLVIALYGRWGSGKSSIKNLLLQELKNRGAKQPEPVDFNPWQWESGKLAEAFFREVSKGIRKADLTENGEKTAARFAMLGTVAMLAVTTGYAVSTIDSSQTQAGLTNIGLIFRFGREILTAIREGMSAEAEFRRKSLPEMKAMLATHLRKMPKQVFIVMDDIDRLADEEIRLLFQLIKAQTDYPNLIFLLLCDREVVADALGKGTSDDGDRYLRKIVHAGYNVPYTGEWLIEKELRIGLNALLTAYQAYVDFDSKIFEKLLSAGCRAYFENLRDVKRFLAGLDFHFHTMTVDGALEVNPVDSFVVELLRQFEPDVYSYLPRVRYMLTGEPFSPILEHEVSDRKRAYDNMMTKARDPIVGEILEIAFPRLSQVKNEQESVINGREDEERRSLRVCNHMVFDRYFTANIPSGQVAESALRRIIGLAADRKALETVFLKAINDDNIWVLLDQLRFYRREIAGNAPVSFVTVLFDIDPDLPEIRVGPWGHPIELEVGTLIRDILQAIPNSSHRKTALVQAITATKSVLIPVMVLRALDHDSAVEVEKTISPDDFTELIALGLQRIGSASEDGTLQSFSMQRLIYTLYSWVLWDSASARAWASIHIADDPTRLVAFLQHYYHPRPRPFTSFDLNEILEILPIDVILDRLHHIDFDELDDAAKLAIDAFQYAAQ
ncbi:MAG: KAP family P-loop NTPase fold protein [Armatimonadota bacterium]